MPSIKDLKKRIGTVKNTQQTTRAMKMVSAAKLRRAQEAIMSQRPYARHIEDLLKELLVDPLLQVGNPFLVHQSPFEIPQQKRTLALVVTSDRGLCGGFNSNIIKACQRWVAAQPNTNLVQLAFVGRKGHDFFKNRKIPISRYFLEQGGKVTFLKAKEVADTVIQQFLAGEFEEVKIIYNEFKNAVTQQVSVEDFLPLNLNTRMKAPETAALGPSYIVKPSKRAVVTSLLEKNFSIQMFRILLESQAGEHGARMSAMENATKNAGEMMRKLALQYNKQRQAGITKELLEIISGSESQKG